MRFAALSLLLAASCINQPGARDPSVCGPVTSATAHIGPAGGSVSLNEVTFEVGAGASTGADVTLVCGAPAPARYDALTPQYSVGPSELMLNQPYATIRFKLERVPPDLAIYGDPFFTAVPDIGLLGTGDSAFVASTRPAGGFFAAHHLTTCEQAIDCGLDCFSCQAGQCAFGCEGEGEGQSPGEGEGEGEGAAGEGEGQ